MLRLFCYHTIPVNIVVHIAESRTSHFLVLPKDGMTQVSSLASGRLEQWPSKRLQNFRLQNLAWRRHMARIQSPHLRDGTSF